MTLELSYALLALGGVACGLIARALSLSIHGGFGKQLVFHRLTDVIAIIPGIALVVWLVPLSEPSRLFQAGAMMGLFSVTYVCTRLVTHRWAGLRSTKREKMVPFKHWLELMGTDPRAAHQFLKAYLDDRGGSALSDLRVAYADLSRQASQDPHLSAALDQLRAEIAQRKQGLFPGATL